MKFLAVLVAPLALGCADAARAAVEHSCAEAPVLKSRAHDRPATVVFAATGAAPAALSWIDDDGKRGFDGSIVAMRRVKKKPVATYPWLIADGSGACLVIVAADGRSLQELVGSPARGFSERKILGWSVKVNADFEAANPLMVKQALALLEQELRAIRTALPPRRVAQLQPAVFWLDERVGGNGPVGAQVPVYHPAREWLREHGLNPDMAGGIELPSAQAFLDSYSWEPWAILHELAHFFQHNVLGDDNAVVKDAYAQAQAAHLYRNVLRYDGTKQDAYALQNEREYFAELTEAYFGRNDYFPFTRDELAAYDPTGFAMIKRMWEGR